MICTVCPGCNKEMREGASYAYFGGRHWCFDCAKDRGYPGYPGNKVRSLYFDFADGAVWGDISGCTRNEVADALERIALVLRSEEPAPGHVDFSNGRISVFYPGPADDDGREDNDGREECVHCNGHDMSCCYCGDYNE